jgi:hypothetical protein
VDLFAVGLSSDSLFVEDSDSCDVGGVGGTLELTGTTITGFTSKAGLLNIGEAALSII